MNNSHYFCRKNNQQTMNRRDTLKLLGSLPLMAFGTTRVSASEHEAVKASAQSPKNIVLISADGMGVCQWQAAMVAAHGKLNLGRMQSAGLLTTNPADVFCGDAPSHSTALATGVNSHKGAVSVDMDNKPVKTITELLKEQGLAVGIVSANTLVEGSIVPFIGHAQNRMATEALTASLLPGQRTDMRWCVRLSDRSRSRSPPPLRRSATGAISRWRRTIRWRLCRPPSTTRDCGLCTPPDGSLSA